MHIAACVQPAKLVRLHGAAGDRHRVHAALDWAHADAIIRRHPIDILFVDPQFDAASEPRTDRIRAVRARYKALPMIVYASLGASTLRPLFDLGTEGLEEFVLFGLDDDPRRLRELLERQPGSILSQNLLTRLRVPLSRMPESVGSALERLIRNPTVFSDVGDLANAAGVPRRSLYRHLERAGLVSPHDLMTAARLLRAHAFLRGTSYSLELVAEHVRFGDAEAMAQAMKWGVGTTPARARDRMGSEEFVERLAGQLVPNAGGHPRFGFGLDRRVDA